MKNQGFTLLEVLVALAVLGIALAAVMQSVGMQAENGAYLRQKTLAFWVAQNRLNELQMQAAWPAPGEDKGSERMGGQLWYWQTQIEETPDPDLRRVNISVFIQEDDKEALGFVSGFVGQH